MRTVKYEEKYPELERFLKYFKENKKYIRNFNIASTVEFQHETKTHVQSFYRESFDDGKYISVACTEKDYHVSKYEGQGNGEFRYHFGIENTINNIRDYVHDEISGIDLVKVEIQCGDKLFKIYDSML